MTNEQINEAVALELGYQEDKYGIYFNQNGDVLLCDDFCTDHNAAARMRRAIREDERETFVNCLARVGAIPDGTFDLSDYIWMGLEATPRQQAEAFLRMRGKWVEGAKV